MFDWFWRMFYELDKDLIKKHQLDKAKNWEAQQNYLKNKKEGLNAISEGGIKESIKGKEQLKSYNTRSRTNSYKDALKNNINL